MHSSRTTDRFLLGPKRGRAQARVVVPGSEKEPKRLPGPPTEEESPNLARAGPEKERREEYLEWFRTSPLRGRGRLQGPPGHTHLRPTGEAFGVTNDEVGVDELVTRLQEARTALVVVEATGGFERTVATALAAKGIAVTVVNPRQVRDEAIEVSPTWRENEALLRGVPGVGPVLARTLLAELPELGDLAHKQLAALVGVAPLNRDSGLYRGRRSVWGGRARVREVLYMAALVASKHNPIIQEFYERLVTAASQRRWRSPPVCASC